MEHTKYPGVLPQHVIGSNTLAELGIFLGLVGAPWFMWVLLTQAAATGVQRWGLLLLIWALMANLEGGMVTFRFWGFIALYWGALAVADSQPARPDTQRARPRFALTSSEKPGGDPIAKS